MPATFHSELHQEVDRLEKLIPILEAACYSHFYVSGPEKQHGCLIAWDKCKYRKVSERALYYDEQEVRQDGGERARRGSSFQTKNIGALVALESLRAQGETEGCIVATTHLFWHPRYGPFNSSCI
jgi:RNA exonuclease NGL2